MLKAQFETMQQTQREEMTVFQIRGLSGISIAIRIFYWGDTSSDQSNTQQISKYGAPTMSTQSEDQIPVLDAKQALLQLQEGLLPHTLCIKALNLSTSRKSHRNSSVSIQRSYVESVINRLKRNPSYC